MTALILTFIAGAVLGLCGGFLFAGYVIAKSNWKIVNADGKVITQ